MCSPNRCFGLCIPGVSTNIYWLSPLLTIPLILSRVVPDLSETIATFSSINLFIKVDLPTLGLPTMEMKPDFMKPPISFFKSIS